MAWELIRHNHQLPIVAATTILPRQPLQLVGTTTPMVAPVSSHNVETFGVNGPATYVTGEAVAVYEADNYVKMVAAASVGVGAVVGVASPGGAVGPIAGASGSVIRAVGKTFTEGRENERITVLINPRTLSNAGGAY
jgi:hypothetical protein